MTDSEILAKLKPAFRDIFDDDRSVPQACLWCPSTVFLTQPDSRFNEYASAKARGEALCEQLSA
jgi:hypothetical protein